MRPIYLRLNALYVFLVICVFAAQTQAQTETDAPIQGRVVLVSMVQCCPAQAWIEAEAALEAEFQTIGLEVITVPSTPGDERQRRLEMTRFAEEHQAACAVRILRPEADQNGGIELWVEDRVTGKTLFRNLHVSSTDDNESAAIAAIRTIETLRASLIELRLESSQNSETEVPEPIESLIEETLPEPEDSGGFAIWIGGGVLGTPGSLAPQVSLSMIGRYNVIRPLAIELDTLISVWSEDVRGSGLQSTFNAALIRLWFLWTPGPFRRIHFALGAGAGIALAWAESEAAPDIIARRDTTAVASVSGRFSVHFAITDLIDLRFDFTAGVLLPEVRVFLDHEIAESYGVPLFEGLFAFGIRIP